MIKKITRFRLLSTGVLFLLVAALALVLFTSNAVAASQIYGTVTDAETGRPVEGATVYIYDPASKETRQKEGVYQTQTDMEGYYELDCDPGDYHIYVSKDGYDAYDEAVILDGQVVYNVELTPDSGGKDDPIKDDPTKDDSTKDDPTKDDPNKDDTNEETGISYSVLLVIAGVIPVVIGIVVGFLVWKKKGQKTSKTGTIKNDDWTTCPECGTDLKMKDLAAHNENVHSKLSKSNKKKMTKKRGKQKIRMKNRGGADE